MIWNICRSSTDAMNGTNIVGEVFKKKSMKTMKERKSKEGNEEECARNVATAMPFVSCTSFQMKRFLKLSSFPLILVVVNTVGENKVALGT